MKKSLSVFLSLLLILGMLASLAVPTTAAVVPTGNPDDEIVESNITANKVLEPINPHASQEAKNLYAYLQVVGESQSFINGQFDINATELTNNSIMEEFGIQPALYSTRYRVKAINAGDGKGVPVWDTEDPNQLAETNQALDFLNVETVNGLLQKYYEQGNVLLVHSDSAPEDTCAAVAMESGKYTETTDAIIELDATNPDRNLRCYALWMHYQQQLIDALKDLEARGVKAYMWRPWIEFNLRPFGGVSDEGCAAFRRVFRQTVDMMIDAQLTGFLVCYSPSSRGNTLTRNPGNDYVDTYSLTCYSMQEWSGKLVNGIGGFFSNYDWYVKSGKPIGLSEFSCRDGVPSKSAAQARASVFSLLQDTVEMFPRLAWVNFWGDGTYAPLNDGGGKDGNDDALLYLDSPFTLNLEEIIDYRNTATPIPGVARLYKTADASGSFVALAEKDYAAADLAALGMTAKQVRALRVNNAYTVTFFSGDNCTGEHWGFGTSADNIPAAAYENFKSLRVQRSTNIAYNQNEIYASVDDGSAWKANDGTTSMWTGDVFDDENEAEQGTAWLYITYDEPKAVNRYVVKMAGAVGNPATYNLADFQLQYSHDGENWATVDTVSDNTAHRVDRYLPQTTVATYFRLLITKPNSLPADRLTGAVSVMEFELYGVDLGEMAKYVNAYSKIVKATAKTSSTGITVSWNKVTGASGYWVYRSQLVNGQWNGWTRLKGRNANATSWVDTTIQPGATYKYAVRGVVEDVLTKYTASNSVKLEAGTPKVTVANSNTGITVKWDKQVGVTKGYWIYRRQQNGSTWTDWTRIKGRNVDATSWVDTTAKAGVNYRYTVRADYGDFLSGWKTSGTVRRLATPKVTIANANGGITVKWNKIAGVTNGYWIYRREVKNGKWTGWTRIKGRGATATSWTDTSVKNGVNYRYTVRAAYGNCLSAYETTGTLRRLTTPVVKVAKASNGVKVSWNKNTAATKGYWVYRRQLVNGKWSGWTRIKGRGAGYTYYVDTTAKKGVTYQYTVRSAYNTSLSAYTASASVKR